MATNKASCSEEKYAVRHDCGGCGVERRSEISKWKESKKAAGNELRGGGKDALTVGGKRARQ